MTQPESTIIAHRYPLDRLAIRQVIKRHHPQTRIIEAINWQELLWQLTRNRDCGLLMLDLALLSASSLNLLQQLLHSYPALNTLAISSRYLNLPSQQLLQHGIRGNISSKDTPLTLRHAVTAMAANRLWFPKTSDTSKTVPAERFAKLSKREHHVLRELGNGLMNKHIADVLDISHNTAKAHVCSILRKLELNSRTQVVLAYRQSLSR